ncbi:MAG: glycosyltransferase family 9 protein [Candidatus Omnitrophica bacterium]|nr:glycosyltransferase family 9 protein [Candidatus Omnitrophota bacterium]
MPEVRKVLIVELWGIGDVVMMSAVLQPIRAAFPQAEICVLSQPHGREILLENREVDRFFMFRFPWIAFRGKYFFWRWDWSGIVRIIMSLRREKFDLLLDARGDPRNVLLAGLIGAKRSVVFNKSDRIKHRVAHWGEVLLQLGLKPQAMRPSITLIADELIEADRFLVSIFAGRPARLAGIHPGAAQKVRCWSLARFEAIASRLKAGGVGVLVLAEPDGYGEEISRSLGLPSCRLGLRQLAAIIARLDLLVCNDTGVMHIAAAVDTPLVAVFGPGSPDFIGPRGVASVVLRECRYRPCFDHCRRDSAECLDKVTVDDVWKAVVDRLDTGGVRE